jgi:hypothetical protein
MSIWSSSTREYYRINFSKPWLRRTKNRKRHNQDKGTGLQRWVVEVLQLVLDNKSWKRHPAPFSKTRKGYKRREERRIIKMKKGISIGGL